eukprot:scaffold96_cov172-Amphora_coffeaeformis.AAC.9
MRFTPLDGFSQHDEEFHILPMGPYLLQSWNHPPAVNEIRRSGIAREYGGIMPQLFRMEKGIDVFALIGHRGEFVVPPPIQTMRFAKLFRFGQQGVLHQGFVQGCGTGLLCPQNEKGRCRPFSHIDGAIDRSTRLSQHFSLCQSQSLTRQYYVRVVFILIHVIQNQMYAMIDVTIRHGVPGLIVDLKHKSRPRGDAL